MKGKPQKDITILWGLPASGKSTYAASKADLLVHVIDLDQIGNKHSGHAFFQESAKAVRNAINATHIILDGLICDNASCKNLMEAITYVLKDICEPMFKIVWWRKDVEACLQNDNGRRGVDAKITIENTVFERPNPEVLGITEKRLTAMTVYRKPSHVVWAEGLMHADDAKKGKLDSSRWSLGGTWGHYSGSSGKVDPEPQPANFDEFDQLLEKICPTINFLQYKKAYRDSVTIEQSEEGDYYGGSVSYAYYSCDLKKLYEVLTEFGVVSV